MRPAACRALPPFLLTFMLHHVLYSPLTTLSLARQHRVIIIRLDGGSGTRSVCFLAAFAQLFSVCLLYMRRLAYYGQQQCEIYICGSSCLTPLVPPDRPEESPHHRPERARAHTHTHTHTHPTSGGKAKAGEQSEDDKTPNAEPNFPSLIIASETY